MGWGLGETSSCQYLVMVKGGRAMGKGGGTCPSKFSTPKKYLFKYEVSISFFFMPF